MTVLGAIFLPSTPAERLRETAQAADAAGLEELWLWEDCFEHGGVATTAAALAWTQRLRVGIGVLPIPLRNPALTAMEIASLHHMFPGRVIVGVGHGVQDWMGQAGVRAESPMTLLSEYLAALRELVAGNTVTTQGRYVRLADVALHWPPAQPPPLHVGATGAKTLALAGRLGDGVVLSNETTDGLREARARFDAARPPGAAPGRVSVYVAGSGTAASVAGDVHRFADAGADAVILQPTADRDPVDYVRFVAEEVRPLVR